jgi:hypothetical protein
MAADRRKALEGERTEFAEVLERMGWNEQTRLFMVEQKVAEW